MGKPGAAENNPQIEPGIYGPPSFVQEEILCRMRDHPQCARRYDLIRLCELRGRLNIDCLIAALNDVVSRHAALRTVIEMTSGEPRQRIRGAPALRVRHDVASAAAFAEELLDARQTTDDVLSGKMLFRPQLAVLRPDHHLLAIAIHHLISDSASFAVFWRDLSASYRTRLRGEAPTTSAIRPTYMEFSDKQRRDWPSLAPPALSYWRALTAGAPRAIRWPQPATQAPSYACDTHRFWLPDSEADRVKRLAIASHASPFLVLLTATGVAIADVTGQTDLLFGTDFANRELDAELESIGMYINTRLTRVRIASSKSFSDLLREVREMWLDSDEHNAVHLSPILRELDIPSLTSVQLDQNDLDQNPDFPGVEVTPVPVTRQDPYWREFLMNWHVGANRVGAEIHYQPSRVSPAAVSEVAAQITRTLRSAIE